MLETKAFDSAVSVENADEGIVHAVVSVFSNVDLGGDCLVPGAFSKSLESWKQRGKLPAGIFMHDRTRPLARTLEMYEAEDGLHVLGKFNLEVQDARECFSNIKNEIITEYSFGYVVRDSEKRGNVRMLKDVDIFEWSPVLLGMNPATHTLGVKQIPHAGMSLDEHFDSVHAAVAKFAERMGELKELRAKDGRNLSGSRREQLKTLQTDLERLYCETEPRLKADEAARLFEEIKANLARG